MNNLKLPRRKHHDTLFSDTGLINIENTDIPDRIAKYLTDIFTTLIDIEWRWNLLIFFSGFVLTWLVFAVYFFLLCYLHGYLNETAIPIGYPVPKTSDHFPPLSYFPLKRCRRLATDIVTSLNLAPARTSAFGFNQL